MLMISNPLRQQISFITELEKLKTILRANRALDGRQENSAEHSWQVALMGIVLQEHAATKLDMLKVTKLLLLHDIVEIDAGDTWLFAANQDEKLSAERTAAQRIFSLLPPDQGQEYLSLWEEFKSRSSDEAKFAATIDALAPLLNHLQTGRPEDGTVPATLVRQKKAFVASCVPALWPLVEALIEESAHAGLYV